MINALAPGMRRGCPWVWISIVLACGLPPTVRAQVGKGSGATKKVAPAAKAETKKDAPAAKAETKKDAPAAKAEVIKPEEGNAPNAEEAEDQKAAKVEVFKDPHAEAALKVFKSSSFRPVSPAVFTRVKTMAATPGGAVDRDEIQRFVSGMAYELTEKSNINALINHRGSVGGRAARVIQTASDNLLDVLQTARLAKNADFLTAYNAVLLDVLPKLLDNNLISRIQAMIVLGQTGDPNALPVFVTQLKDPNQTVWVKLWAARGISRAVENGTKVDSIGGPANDAAKALSDHLNDEKNPLPWPVQLRALEALGAMRVSSPPNSATAEMATTAMKFLADPQARPEVRAQAAWALGMIRVNQTTRNYNYALIAYNTAQLAAELGEKINAAIVPNKPLSEYLTNLLIAPIYQAFNGMDGARDSGLLKVPGGYPTLANTRQIADLTAAVTKAAVDLVRSAPGQQPKFQKDLDDRVAGLKAYLEKNPPKDYRLVPNGREFRPEKERVAKAPDHNPGVAGGHGR